MKEIKDVLGSKSVLQVFLSICQGNKTEKEISQNTGFSQPTVHQYLRQLKNIDLVKFHKKGIRFLGKKIKFYSANPEFLIILNLIKRQSIGYSKSKEFIKILTPLSQKFLIYAARYPIWRNKYFIEKEVKKRNLGKGWPFIQKSFYRYKKLSFYDLAEAFIEYIIFNKSCFDPKIQKTIDDYLECFFVSVEGTVYLNELHNSKLKYYRQLFKEVWE